MFLPSDDSEKLLHLLANLKAPLIQSEAPKPNEHCAQ